MQCICAIYIRSVVVFYEYFHFFCFGDIELGFWVRVRETCKKQLLLLGVWWITVSLAIIPHILYLYCAKHVHFCCTAVVAFCFINWFSLFWDIGVPTIFHKSICVRSWYIKINLHNRWWIELNFLDKYNCNEFSCGAFFSEIT